ncbi:MAG: hypothetical protein ACTHM6_00945 [Tepidisphaeraceae bacterium]
MVPAIQFLRDGLSETVAALLSCIVVADKGKMPKPAVGKMLEGKVAHLQFVHGHARMRPVILQDTYGGQAVGKDSASVGDGAINAGRFTREAPALQLRDFHHAGTHATADMR